MCMYKSKQRDNHLSEPRCGRYCKYDDLAMSGSYPPKMREADGVEEVFEWNKYVRCS